MRSLGSARFARWSGLLLAIGVGASCAKFPDESTDAGGTRISFRMTIAGKIRKDYVYLVALSVSDELSPPGVGPQPVLRYPSANGLIAGGATHFVEWNPLQPKEYVINRFSDPSDGTSGDGLRSYTQTGVPITTVEVETDRETGEVIGRTIEFEIATAQIADTVAEADKLQSIRVNFLTMNVAAREDRPGRVFDALGRTDSVGGVNETIRVLLGTSNQYSNSRSNGLEPTGDVGTPQDPDVDISDWSIEVRRQ